jgi:hypothetical protein
MGGQGRERGTSVALHDLNEFFKLSAALNYQLSARVVGHDSILATIVGGRRLSDADRDILMSVLEYLEQAYHEKYRRLGPKAVLHPLRASALLVRAHGEVVMLDLLAELLHDKFEDILAEDYRPDEWQRLEAQFHNLLKRVDPKSEWFLMERLDQLTRRKEEETYYQYIGRLLERATLTPELVRVKLADRLDNTLDMRVDFRDPLDEVRFFQSMFQLLFSRHYQGFAADMPHPPRPPLDGARRLYDLFKNTVVLSLVRQTKAIADDDETAGSLFEAIAIAGMLEAQRILVHIFTYHYQEVERQRQLMLETMEYCWHGGLESVTPGSAPHRLDGLFLERFDSTSSEIRQRQLEKLYDDKELMIAAASAFIVIFLNFLHDESYFVQGVSTAGIHPDASEPRGARQG